MRLIGKTPKERLEFYTVRKGKCLVWTGAKNSKKEGKGYGVMTIKGRLKFVHVLAYELAKGSVPAGKVVRHTCDVRLCCEPSHLILGTMADNSQDMVDRGRSKKGIKHGRAVLTEKDVIAIRAARTKGASVRALAKEYDVSVGAIYPIVKGKTWKHLLEDK